MSEEGKKLKTKTTEVAVKMMRNVLKDIKEEDLMSFDRVMMQIKDNLDNSMKNIE